MDYQHLFVGSKIPYVKDPAARKMALHAEHEELRGIFRDLENDPIKKISMPVTRAMCAIASALPDEHNKESIAVWGEDYVFEGACAVMMAAVRQLIDDPRTRFGDNSMYPRLLEAMNRKVPLAAPDAPDNDMSL